MLLYLGYNSVTNGSVDTNDAFAYISSLYNKSIWSVIITCILAVIIYGALFYIASPKVVTNILSTGDG